MKELMTNSIHISDSICVCWPQYGEDKEELIDIAHIRSKFNDAYNVNNSTICYIVNHNVYVTPYTNAAIATLEKAGLTRQLFYVPLSNWDYPKDEDLRTKWFHLRELARESFLRDYEMNCRKWCDEFGIKELSKATMARCMRIPQEGIPIKTPYYESFCYPACNEFCTNRIVFDRLGRYCMNNGIVLFVYRDGHSYLAKGCKIIDELIDAGYVKSDLFVPLSNGEQISDSELASQWEQIPKK